MEKETLTSTKALAGIVVDHTTLLIALRTNRSTVGPPMVAKAQEKEKMPRERVKEESLRAKAAKVAARVERKAKAAEKVRKVKVKAKERFSDSTVQSMEEMLEQEEIGTTQVGQKENGMTRAGMKVFGKKRVLLQPCGSQFVTACDRRTRLFSWYLSGLVWFRPV